MKSIGNILFRSHNYKFNTEHTFFKSLSLFSLLFLFYPHVHIHTTTHAPYTNFTQNQPTCTRNTHIFYIFLVIVFGPRTRKHTRQTNPHVKLPKSINRKNKIDNRTNRRIENFVRVKFWKNQRYEYTQ